jgi:bud emergence protein 1
VGPISQRTFSTISRTSPIAASTSPPLKARPKVYYATVLHDFEAERSDELDARSGDMVSVVAQSNREWFVAKPIGKLGRPGLIPASFVEVKDPATQQIISMDTIVESGNLPSVEDWKREMLDYKASSIALGVLDDNVAPVTRSMAPASPPMPAMPPVFQQQTSPPPPMVQPAPPVPPPVRQPSPEPEPEPEVYQDYSNPDGESDPVYAQPQDLALLPEGILVSANVVSFHYEMEEYWFRVHALFQPYSASGSNVLPPARQLVLFRAYNDFYDFQVELLQVFPREGGRDPAYPRVLPYMPGPADQVNHEITASRQVELDDYLAKMADLRRSDARYVLEDALVRAFLAPKPGDVETEVEPVPEEVYSYQDEDNDMQEMANEMANMGVGSAQAQSYDDYGQDEEIIRPSQPSQQNSYQQRGYEDSTLRPISNGRNPSPLPPHMRSSGYEQQQNGNGYTQREW